MPEPDHEAEWGDETSQVDLSALTEADTAIRPPAAAASDADTSRAGPAQPDALEIAVAEGWLDPEVSAELVAAADGDRSDAFRRAFDTGKLSAREYDMVAALAGIREVAPGYRVVSLLGRGGMGAVYEAVQENLQRPVALKTILVDAESNDEAVLRFEQEARTIAKLRHPNIITAFDFGRHAGRLFLAMELVEGEDLDTRLKGNKLSELQALSIARQIAAALLAAAKHGVTHRDVKPANVLLVPAPEGSPLPEDVPLVKVADFGLAFLADTAASERVTSANVAVGSPHYMAPELLRGEDASVLSDIYALGATLFRMLSSEPPFAGKPLSVLINEKLSGTTPLLEKVSPDVRSLVGRLMASDAEDRPPDFAVCIEEIDQLLGLHSDSIGIASASAARTSVRPSGAARRTPVNWRTVLLGTFAVCAAAIVVATQAPRPQPRSEFVRAETVPEVQPASLRELLFDGFLLTGWSTRDGKMNPGKSQQPGLGLRVLAGAGETQRAIPDAYLTEYYRIDLMAFRGAGAEVVVTFNCEAEFLDKPGDRYEIAVNDTGCEVRKADGRGQTTTIVSRPKEVGSAADAANEASAEQLSLRIEFRPFGQDRGDGWFVFVNDEQLGDGLPYFGQPYGLWGLASRSGASEFYEIGIERLRAVPASDAGSPNS